LNHKRIIQALIVIALLALAAGPSLAQSEAAGIKVGPADWLERLPVVLVATLFVIIVDLFFVIPAWRNRRAQQQS
jgi:hypothetical protein